ncbi:MAG TPA: glycosyltransferase family 87 protein [Acidisphaera sp.]|nr:glycosyltransferase family 87 protein [Acidisphaera sp.]
MQAAVLSFPVRKKRPLTLALVGVVILLLVAFDLRCLASIARSLGRFGPHDAFVLWSFGRFVLTHPLAGLYDDAALHAFQSHLLGETMQGGDATYYYYPPPFAFLLAALSVLPCAPAYLLLQSADFGLYAAAVLPGGLGRLRAAMLGILPATWLALIAGQNGFLSGALLIGGMRLCGSRPVLGGVLLGLLTYKPQLGLLVPVALAASGRWRTIGAAAATVMVLVAATGAGAGWDSWIAWSGSMAAHGGAFAAGRGTDFMMPTVAATLRQIGLPPAEALAGQLVATALAAWCVWSCYRRHADDVALAALCVATFLATPYAMFYDLPAFAAAIVFIVCRKLRDGSVWTAADVALPALAAAIPAALTVPWPVPVGAPVLAALLVWVVRRHRADCAGPRIPALQPAGA